MMRELNHCVLSLVYICMIVLMTKPFMSLRCRSLLSEPVVIGQSTSVLQERSTTTTLRQSSHSGKNPENGVTRKYYFYFDNLRSYGMQIKVCIVSLFHVLNSYVRSLLDYHVEE